MDTVTEQQAAAQVGFKQFLKDGWAQAKPLTPMPHYLLEGDQLTLFFREDLPYAERVDDLLTVYFSDETDELVGCKIKGVSLLVQNVVSIVGVQDDNIDITFLFLSAATGNRQPREEYYQLSNLTRGRGLNVSLSELRKAAA